MDATTIQDDTSQVGHKRLKPKRPCLYCGIFNTQLVRHLTRKHKEEEAVAAALKLPKAEQNQAFERIRKLAMLKCNRTLKLKGEELLRERAQGKSDLVMCIVCKGFFSKTTIARHKRSCKDTSTYLAGYINFSSNAADDSDGFTKEIIHKFRNDETGNVCRNDNVVLLHGKKLWAKSVRKEKRFIMNDMRTLGNLIIELRKVAHDDKLGGEDIIKRENFEILTKAIQNMTTKGDGLKAGLKLAQGFLIRKISTVMKEHYIMANLTEKATEVDRFSEVLDLNWDFIFYRAQLICDQRRQSLRKPRDMPLESDIKKLREFIINTMNELTTVGHRKWDSHDFICMRNLLVARLTLFNARRGGEPARMKLSDWRRAEKGSWVDQNLVDKITDPLEKELMDDLKLAYQSGNGSQRLVPVWFPKDTITPLNKLLDERLKCGISNKNVFLFPNTGSSNDHAIGRNSIQAVAGMMGDRLEKPHLLIADKCRHRTSTLFALLEIPLEKRQVFYRHMGHSESLAIAEITEVGDAGGHHPADKNLIQDNSDISNKSAKVNPTIKSKKKDKVVRKYTKWSESDTAEVSVYFKSYIENDKTEGVKGSLPRKKQVLKFIRTHTIFSDCNLSEKEKRTLIKTKVFNERKKFRSLSQEYVLK